MWGCFETDESVHAAPIKEDGAIKEPHKIDDFCCCHPKALFYGEDGRIIISHNDIH